MIDSKTAICVGAPNNAKHAALFFDSIWHLCPTMGSAPRAVFPEGYNYDQSLRDRFTEFTYNLFFQHSRSAELFDEAFNLVPVDKKAKTPVDDILLPKNPELIHKTIEQSYIQNVNGIRNSFLKLVSPISPIHPTPVLSSTEGLVNSNENISDIMVTLSCIKIIDVTKTSWQQIVEFRKDIKSAQALRKLRVFLYENCKDKSSSYIEDKINSDLDNYHNAIKRHGFNLLVGSIKTIIDSKNILALSSAGILALLFGGPIVGLTSAATLEIGKLAIHISKDLHALKEFKRDHPLAYIIKATNELKDV